MSGDTSLGRGAVREQSNWKSSVQRFPCKLAEKGCSRSKILWRSDNPVTRSQHYLRPAGSRSDASWFWSSSRPTLSRWLYLCYLLRLSTKPLSGQKFALGSLIMVKGSIMSCLSRDQTDILLKNQQLCLSIDDINFCMLSIRLLSSVLSITLMAVRRRASSGEQPFMYHTKTIPLWWTQRRWLRAHMPRLLLYIHLQAHVTS